MRLVFLAPLLLLAAAPLLARAEEDRLPFDPFADAREDDWAVLVGRFESDGAGESPTRASLHARVVKREEGRLHVREAAAVGGAAEETRVFTIGEAPTLREYFGITEGTISDARFTADTHACVGSAVACTRVDFTWKRHQDTSAVTAWLVRGGKAGGLLGLQIVSREQGALVAASRLFLESAGVGHGETAERGALPLYVLDFACLGEPTDAPLPYNPFAFAKEGDWAAYDVETDSAHFANMRFVECYRVTESDDDQVGLSMQLTKDHVDYLSWNKSFSRTTPLTLRDFVTTVLDLRDPDMKLKALSQSQIRASVGDDPFPCDRMLFAIEAGTTVYRMQLLLSRDAKAPGIVRLDLTYDVEKDRPTHSALVLRGFGSKDATVWGKTDKELMEERPRGHPPR